MVEQDEQDPRSATSVATSVQSSARRAAFPSRIPGPPCEAGNFRTVRLVAALAACDKPLSDSVLRDHLKEAREPHDRVATRVPGQTEEHSKGE